MPTAPIEESVQFPQLLMVYNRRFNARTIRVHVERLREKGFAWWGRFYGGEERFNEAKARERWPHVAELADARAKSGEASLLFVTNFADLHVLKVTQIVLGDRPGGGVRENALDYYVGRSVPIWFRVEDARSLSFDQGTTLDWFDQRLGAVRAGAQRPSGEAYTRTYDPYAAVLYHFPIVVDGPPAKDLFERAKPPRGVKRWADTYDAIAARPVQRARDELERRLVPGLWMRLSEEARDLLANAWVHMAQHEQDEDVDPASGYAAIARAIEVELGTELIGAIEGLLRKLAQRKEGRAQRAIEQRLDEARPRDREGRKVPWSFGPSLKAVKLLVENEHATLERLKLRALVRFGVQLEYCARVKRLRDASTHKGSHRVRPQLRRGVREFFEEGGRFLGPVVEAREEVGAWGA